MKYSLKIHTKMILYHVGQEDCIRL